ncbi:hypothetical protein LSCM1_03496 [Leishmania martiniquensis]|uniref:Cyclic nucleotide-binding domain-containing protein n=1 Tax=Leishmania martiniquensis TaxID=1580590 RepID=A0A836H5B7_9TRYP|nr:hypothetical protein LSCM1_03496 [Leishmania martiniquensis]
MSCPPGSSEAKAATDAMQQRKSSIYASDRVRKVSRRESALPLCMSRAQHEARRQSTSIQLTGKRRYQRQSYGYGNPNTPSLLATPTANGWAGLLNFAEANTEVGRAIQMCSFYPSMRVGGTAFENSLNQARRQSVHVTNGSFSVSFHGRIGGADGGGGGGIVSVLQEDGARMRAMSISVAPDSSATLREAMDESRSMLELSQGSILAASSGGAGAHGSLRSSFSTADAAARTLAYTGGSNMVQLACALKRAAMWEVVVVTALTHRAMELRFRRLRLRRVLERHMLPTLLRRKSETGSIVPKSARSRDNMDMDGGDAASQGAPTDEAGAVPQGTYLRDHDAFFDSLHNATLLQSFAESMTRHRFLPGDVIARAGDSSQKAMHFLISGKCEVCTERWRQDSDDGEPAAGPTAAGDHGWHHQRKTGGGAAPQPTKEVIMAGTSFGGVFGGNATFASTYRALSQCIVWVLRSEDFEQIFRSFADRTMLDKYKEAMRQHGLWWLQQRYHPAKCYGSIPIYRKLTKRASSYLEDFTPVVKVRGETIFSHGDVAGDVYCMLEGTVLRRTKGAAGTYGDDSVAQRLGTNSFTALNVSGRYLMFGEEPHLVPGVQPYTCTVSSRVALFFKVSAERFVNALLDDPLLYAQLRAQLMQRRQDNMRLDLECLTYVPLLQRFPPEKRAELVQHARPRVISRSVPLCDPAQHISDLIIIVSGTVRDPRNYSQKPTAPLEVPAPFEVERLDGALGEEGGGRKLGADGGANPHVKSGKADRRHHAGAGPQSAQAVERGTAHASGSGAGGAIATAGQRSHHGAREGDAPLKGTLTQVSDLAAGAAAEAEEQDGADWNFSFSDVTFSSALAATVMSSNNATNLKAGGALATGSAPVASAQQLQQLLDSAPLVYPDESEDINPALPVQPTRHFASTLGGSWEALLLDKWPNGWESVTTVEMWTIPTRMLRIVYNSCPKPVQLAILNGLRHAQKEDLQLPTLPHTKLPPMSIYAQHGEAVLAAAATAVKDSKALGAKDSSRRGGNTKVASPSLEGWSTRMIGEESGMAEVGTQHSGGSTWGTHSAATRSSDPTKSAAGKAKGKARPLAPVAAGQTALAATLHGPNQKTTQTTRSGAHATQEAPSREGGAQANASAWRAQDGRERRLRRLRNIASARGATKAMPAEPTVDPALQACYDGLSGAADPLMLRIVRDPIVVVPSRRGTNGATLPPGSTPSAHRLPPIISSSEAAPAAAWPALTPARNRWFQEVPSYEPLPGTVHAVETLASPPVFAPNSTVLVSAVVSPVSRHGKKLEGHVAYYAATVSSARAASRAALGEAAVASAGDVATAPVATPMHPLSSVELDIRRSHLPKRRAYAV